MSRLRAAAGMALLSASVVVALGIESCASPTQIVVDIIADAKLCPTLKTGVAVTTPDDINSEALEIYEDGCEARGNRVGTLTITPSGAKDDLVGIRVVGARDGNPDRCGRPGVDGTQDWKDCVLARRRIQFSPGKTVTQTILLTSDCVDRYCGEGEQECAAGQCVEQSQLQPDGAIAPPDDASARDARADADGAAGDPCEKCEGEGVFCINRQCRYDCRRASCENRQLCAPGLDCMIECQGANCAGTTCTTDRSCTFVCGGGSNQPRSCTDIACSAATCGVTCEQSNRVCSGVYVDGGVNTITCSPTTAGEPTCNDVRCRGNCTRLCNDGGCGQASSCEGNCASWDDAGP